MSPDDQKRVDDAIAAQGSDGHVFASGPLLDLLTEFADAGKFHDMADAACQHRQAHFFTSAFVAASIPAKVLNALIKKYDAEAERFMSMEADIPDWASQLKQNAFGPNNFAATVRKIEAALQ